MNRPSLLDPPTANDVAYEVDTAAWCDAQVALLRARAFEAIDLDNIIEEIESLGREQGHQNCSRLVRIIEHLLKLDASSDINPRRKWKASVIEQRRRLLDRLRNNPSLRRLLPAFVEEVWPDAVRAAKAGLRAEEEAAVDQLPRYTLEQLLDDDYFGNRDATA